MNKKISDFKLSPIQDDLFQLTKSKKCYSNTIELYEVMPKYFYGRQNRVYSKEINAEVLPVLEKRFTFRGMGYNLAINPARIQDSKTKKSIEYYPSQREEIIEDVIKKMAFQGRGQYYDDLFGILFSLREIEQELTKFGHRYKREEIKLAILINNRTSQTLISDDKSIQLESHPFETSIIGKKALKGQKLSDDQFTMVRFNPLVTKSIKDKTIKAINIDKCLSYKNPLSRYIHKRISHLFQPIRVAPKESNLSQNTNEAMLTNERAYTIHLTTLINDSGSQRSKEICKDLLKIEKALEELKYNNIVKHYIIKPINAEKPKHKILDYKISIFATNDFTSDIIQANIERNRINTIKQ